MRRRHLLASIAPWIATAAHGQSIRGAMPFVPGASEHPPPFTPGPWRFFTPEEGALMEAIADRLIPPDPETPGGKDAGCAVFIDRQLAGAYGSSAALYMRPPFQDGLPTQGEQSALTPAQRYRQGLAAIGKYVSRANGGKTFPELAPERQDAILTGLEKNTIQLEGSSGPALFEYLLKDTHMGFFADPIYGGNKDMCAWKMIGFPGARYDYRPWIDKHNETFPLPPVGIAGRPDWRPRAS